MNEPAHVFFLGTLGTPFDPAIDVGMRPPPSDFYRGSRRIWYDGEHPVDTGIYSVDLHKESASSGIPASFRPELSRRKRCVAWAICQQWIRGTRLPSARRLSTCAWIDTILEGIQERP